jgi:pimeloyl-ACP methyl ester carboxylesterase
MTAYLPRLRQVRVGAPEDDGRKIIVFVHGIFSSHATFDKLIESFRSDARFDAYDLATYDYDWGEPILRSAERLRDILNGRLPERAVVTLIGHSMGGLVSRFALIGGDLRGVRRIVMLGTPNFGALTARQISTLWQVSIAGAAKVTPLFPRKAGLRDLTRPQTLFANLARPSPAHLVARARQVEYVTVPGLFYHEERRDTETGDGAALPFTIGGLAARAFAGWSSFTEIKIDRPHDGIVEEASVSLIARTAGRVSEKSSAIQQPAKRGRTYAHITPFTMRECAHSAIQNDDAVAAAIKGIMLAGGTVAWSDALPDDERDTFIDIEIP